MDNALLTLLEAVRNNDAKTAYAVAQQYNMAERDVLIYILEEASTFLRRFNKDWKESMNFPAEDEE